MSLWFTVAAERELEAACAWYEARRPGLGLELLAHARAAAHTVGESPASGAPLTARLRRILLSRFPYQLIYFVEPTAVVVIAFAHLRRRHGYWRGRIRRT